MKIVAILSLLVFLTGCASTNYTNLDREVASITTRLHTGEYEMCLEEIDALLGLELNPLGQAMLRLQKGICLEAVGKQAEADFMYEDVAERFPYTTYSDQAERRLARKDGDQKEQVQMAFASAGWKMVSRVWDESYLRTLYAREKGKTEPKEVLHVSSRDRGGELQTLEDHLTRLLADANLKGGEWEMVERTRREAVLFITSDLSESKRALLQIVRLFEGERLHQVTFATGNVHLSKEERARWIEWLKTAEPFLPNSSESKLMTSIPAR